LDCPCPFDFHDKCGAKILILLTICANRSVYDDATMERMDWADDRLQERFDTIDRRFDRVDQELRDLGQRFDGLNRTLLQIGGGVIATLIAGFMGIVATQL
jgi:hypothetical protein